MRGRRQAFTATSHSQGLPRHVTSNTALYCALPTLVHELSAAACEALLTRSDFGRLACAYGRGGIPLPLVGNSPEVEVDGYPRNA